LNVIQLPITQHPCIFNQAGNSILHQAGDCYDLVAQFTIRQVLNMHWLLARNSRGLVFRIDCFCQDNTLR
jgi:hypothetical protein